MIKQCMRLLRRLATRNDCLKEQYYSLNELLTFIFFASSPIGSTQGSENKPKEKAILNSIFNSYLLLTHLKYEVRFYTF